MLFKAIAALTVAASALAQAAGQNVTITAPSPTWWCESRPAVSTWDRQLTF